MKKNVKTMALILLAMVLVLSTLTASAEYQKPYIVHVFEATPLDLSLYSGKALILHFFTEGSANSAEELGKLKQVFETYSQDDLQIVLIHVWEGEDESNTINVVSAHGLEKMIFFEDRTGEVAAAISVPSTPFTLYIDKEGYMEDASVYPFSYEIMTEIIDYMGVSRAAGTPEETPAPDDAEPTATPEGLTIGQPNPDITPSPEPTATTKPTTSTKPAATNTATTAATATPTKAPSTNSGSPPGSKGIVVGN